MSKIWIAKRGNLSGPNPNRENQPSYIKEALGLGYHAEVDVWLSNGKYYLGHDRPEYIVPYSFFTNDKLWVHCKNIGALNSFILDPDVNCFAHDKDDFVLTSFGYVWCFPKIQKLTSNCIAVMPEKVKGWDISNCAGICSDYILSYQYHDEHGAF